MSSDFSQEKDLFVFKDDEQLIFVSETGSDSEGDQSRNVWRILIADDEQDVHDATRFALRDTQILGRPLEFYDAYDSAQTLEILRTVPDIAVVLLDVVMDTSNAGLDLVPVIREQLKLQDLRIILRTGEPNQAPEIDVIRDYDINDYKLKSDLTKKKLYASLTSSVRSYKQLRTIENSKKGLDMILRASSELLTQEGLNNFAQGVITHIAALIGVRPEGVICVRKRDQPPEDDLLIIAAAGDFCDLIDHPLSAITEEITTYLLRESLNNRCNVFHRNGVALYLGSHTRGDMSCYVASNAPISEVDKGLLEMFCGNIALCADNIDFLDRLKNFAFTDTLVGLPNRNALEEVINQFIDQGSTVPYSLALIDIDNFAEINAVLGQEYGDRLLCAAADRIKAKFYAPNTVARIGGDTFAVFGPSSHIQEKALLQPFVNPFQIGGDLQLLSITAGVVPLTEIQGRGSEVIKDASIVLKQAKSQNRGQVLMFQRQMVVEARQRLGLLKNLRAAFELNQLFLVFQPKLKLSDLSVTGFEALIRWRDSSGRFVSPAEFIPLAEQSGLIIRMGEWILRNAIAELALLRAKGYMNASMAVNLSVAQLEHPDILEMLQRVMGESNIEPSFIELEITESIAMGDIEANLKRLEQIRDMGFKLSMDDFGTGFSSFAYLQKMPINCLKIDRSFVSKSNTKKGGDIVEMIVQLGKTLGLNVIAEGVEEEVQGVLLKQMGCNEVQGFFYAKPMPREELHKWLAERKKRG
jgi:diguanylate cyclase (GGDEF)-like protein